ncbi:MAG TPA: 2-phosphosulfolactate phosphatase [Thermoanaerobaculia bacterium]
MRLEVHFTPDDLTGADIRDHVAVVIDVLRATSVIAQAVASGARVIYPAGTIEEAVRLGQTLDRSELILCGERGGLRIEGFDLGNSPLEFTPDAVDDRTLVMSTTNGTPALVAALPARRTITASFLNLGAAANALAGEAAVTVVCAGRERRFALEDAVCAGMLVERVTHGRRDYDLNDGAIAARALAQRFGGDLDAMMRDTAAGRQLIGIGHEHDVVYCAGVDQLDVVPKCEDRRITK